MFELDELGEMAWVPLALLAAVMAWRSRSALLAGFAGTRRLQAWRDGQAGLPGTWIANRAGPVIRWAQGAGRSGGLPSGNQSFDNYRDDALRKLEEEQREFRSFLARLQQARDRSEFDAFMAERAR
jgi:hypothetical protein